MSGCPVIQFDLRGTLFMALPVGAEAPDFEIPAAIGEEKIRFKLTESRGKKNVVLAFHPLDWTPV
jgi:peroxiredoxin